MTGRLQTSMIALHKLASFSSATTTSAAYTAVNETDCQDDHREEPTSSQRKPSQVKRLLTLLGTLIIVFITVMGAGSILYVNGVLIFGSRKGSNTELSTSQPIRKQCEQPSVRHEWRSVSSNDRAAYISAVMCLQTQPSRLGLNHSLWVDFPYAHIWYGHDGHDGVSFFAYHRWVLNIYEMALRTECGYQGNMLYWDWTLDWESPYDAPVFDEVYGFGGNGNMDNFGWRGGCVDRGPLAHTMMPYTDFFTDPHCLSRNFVNNTDDLDFWRGQWHPDMLEDALQRTELWDFVKKVEYGMHRALPILVGGDFSAKGSPIDPLFFLHHGQLDRIYWLWQQQDPKVRLTTFSGPKTREDTRNTAKITDTLYFGDLGPVATIGDVLDTKGRTLCYVYE